MAKILTVLFVAALVSTTFAQRDASEFAENATRFIRNAAGDPQIAYAGGAASGSGGDEVAVEFENDVAIAYVEMSSPELDYGDGYPTVGNNVTWTANLWNRANTTVLWGSADARVTYEWSVNGVGQGSEIVYVPPQESWGWLSDPDKEVTPTQVSFSTTWTGSDDEITFEITAASFPRGFFSSDPEDADARDNNIRTFVANAISIGVYVEESLYWQFQENQENLGIGTKCFEDWIHLQVDSLNALMERAVYTATPSGLSDRFRVDKISFLSDGELPLSGSDAEGYPNPSDESVDIQLGYTGDMTSRFTDYSTVDKDNPFFFDAETLERILKTRYAAEQDAWVVYDNSSDRNIEIMEDGEYVAGSSYMPFLGAYSDYVYDGAESGILGDNYEIISEYTANALELIAGDRASDGNGYPPGNLHAFFEDLPAENKITIRDVDGALISGASVSIYQSEGDGSTWYSKTYDNTPEMTFTTNASGEAYVGMNPFSVDADIVHEYGKSNTVAIMRVGFDGRVDYHFLDSKDFNYEYWAGNTALGEYDVQTDFSSHEIIMTTPNGGETWRYGTTMDIVWDDAGVTDVKLEYSTNNGTDWTTITTAGSGVTERYTWTVPNVESDQCLIRASDNDDGSVIDVSDATFGIGTPTITTTAPNGGETLTAGDGYDITWSSEYMPTVDIELSTDNGSSWTTIASSVAGDAGSYYWIVSDDPTTTALVRVMDSYQTSFGDTSDATFTIQSSGATPSVWYVDVSVGASGDGTSEAQAFKTINEGIIAADPYDTIKVLPGTYTSFESTATRDERIAIVSTGGADVTTLDGTGLATGRAFRVKSGWTIDGFTFTNFVATTNPNNNAAIKYRNDVDSAAAIVVRNCVFDGNAKIAVGIDGSYAKTIYERNVFMNGSDRVFKGEWRELRLYNNTFYNNDGASTDYLGYVYCTGQTETRVDMRNNTIIDNDIDATTDAVFTVEPLATGKTVKLTEGYNLVNDNTPSDAITAGTFSGATTVETRLGNNLAEDPMHISESLGDFALRVGSPLLDAGTNVGLSYDGSAPEIGSYEGVAFDVDVTYPNGGELIAVGDTVRITWEHTNLENVKVEWSTNSGSNWSVVSASTSADDTVEVVAPEILSTDCLIRVSSIEHPGLIDQSDATFTIRVGGDLYVDDDGAADGSGSALNPVNTIAAALAIAVEGDTIHVMDGTYSASVDDVAGSPDKITIVAENQGQAIIDGATEPVFTPKKEWVIDGLNFINHTGGAVFYFDGDNEYINAAFVTIRNCFFDNNRNILSSTETIDNDGFGGTFDKTESAVKMHNNVITGTTGRIADAFYFKRFVFYNNTVYGNTYSAGDYFQLYGNSLGLSPVNFDVRNNIFSGNSIGGSNQFFDVRKDNDDVVDEINVTYGYNLDYDNNGATVLTYSGFTTVNENNKMNNVSGSDPLFTDASTDDYTLQATSPAMNVGDDVNLEYFSVAPELGAYENWDSPVVEVTAPNGSESYSIGDAVSITWTQSNLGSATIDYSIDGGVNWIEIATGVSGSTETYAWTVPYPPTDQAIVRITDEFDANATDQSDAVFSISNETITVNASGGADYTNIATALSNASDGAEIIVAAGTYTAAGIDPPPIGIQLSSSAGAATTIIDGSSLSGLGFTVNEGWTIDGFTFQNFNDGGSGANAVIVFESTSDSAYWATIKNNVFKSSTKLFLGETGSEARALVHNNVIYDGSERVAYGEWRAFRFLNNTVENVSNTGDNYLIDVFASGQTEARLDVRNNIFSNNTVASGGGAFIHATPSASGNTLILKEGRNLFYNNSPNSTIDYDDVSGADEYVQSFGFDQTTDPSYTDAASDDYNITSASPAVAAGMDVGLPFEGPAPDMGALPYNGSLTLTSPNGGESWTSGATETITWTYDNVANVKIEISSDGGSTWVYEIPSTPAAPGSYDLSVPNMPTDNAVVRLSIAETETVEDQSDAPFTITSADAPVVDGNTTVETQWSETLFTDGTSAGDASHIQGVYAAYDLTYVYFGVMLEEDDCRDNATIVIDYKPGGPAASSTDPFMSKVKYNFPNQPDYVIHKHGYGAAIAAKRWNGSSWADRTAPTASPDFYSDYSGGSAHFLEIKLPREEIENANVISLMVYTSEGSNAAYPGDVDKCAFYAYPEDAGNQTDPTGAASSTTMSVYHADLVVIPNVNNLLGGPYSADANTVALLHFDGDYTNAGTTTDATAVNSGSQSFVEHTEQSLGNLRQALRIDNSNSANKTYLRVADANELDMTGDWTIEMWFKVNSFGPENGYAYSPRLISKPYGSSPVGNYWVNLFGNESAAQAGMRTTSNTYNVILSDSAFIQTGAWYHLSYVHDATKETMAMVIHDANRDPVFVQTKSLAGIANTPVTSTSDLYIGWAGGSLADMFYFDGWIDELRVSDAIRTFNIPAIIENVTQLPNQNSNAAGYDISATIYSLDPDNWLADQRLYFSIDDGASWASIQMTNTSGNEYSATIPDQAKGSDVKYYVWAKDNFNHESRMPAGDDVYYRFGIYREADKVLDMAFDQNLTDESIYTQSPVLSGGVSYLVDKKEGTHSLRFPATTSPASISVDSPFLTGEQFDVQFWFKPLTALRDKSMLIVRPFLPGSTVNENYSIALYANGSLRARYRLAFDLGIDNVDLWLPPGTVQLSQWYHVTYIRTTDSVYVELRNSVGTLVDRNSSTNVSAKPPHLAMGPLKIGWAGNTYNGENAYFSGQIDDLVINNLSRSLGKALPTIDSVWTNLAVTDREGRMTTLFLTEDAEAASGFPELPTMPEGTYDVRFTSDRFVETTGIERRVSLKGVEYPVTLAAGGKAVRIVDAFGGARIKETLRPGETLTIADETIDELVIKEWTIPEEFELYQNFPNPFNPTTTLRFDLPIDGMVKLEVYDILGQKVETLFDGELEAGVHDLKWNAIDYASGVYIYRIEATDFSAVKKMVLMK